MTLALGLMSGTSGDGVSAALVSFKNRSFKLLGFQTFPYPSSVRKKILSSVLLKTPEISSLNFELGRYFADATLKLIHKARVPIKKIAVIGSHGQTLYHGPHDAIPSTFQIGEAAVIAEKTGIPVVSDFRPQDIALGGEGAPLIPFFDFYFYGKGPLRAFQNIGGIANVTVVGKNFRPIAFDTGPGNCLMDEAVRLITKGKYSYDPSGKFASLGKVQMKWADSMMKHPYFRRRPPKSMGREEFGAGFLHRYLGRFIQRSPYDVLASLNYFTAFTIFEGLKKLKVKKMIVSGGGAKNRTLMHHLRKLFSPVPVRSIEELGIPAQAKEPIAFAFFGLRALQRKTNHLPQTTGARHATILGKIIHASH